MFEGIGKALVKGAISDLIDALEIDREGFALLGEFFMAAKDSGNANRYLKESLRMVLSKPPKFPRKPRAIRRPL